VSSRLNQMYVKLGEDHVEIAEKTANPEKLKRRQRLGTALAWAVMICLIAYRPWVNYCLLHSAVLNDLSGVRLALSRGADPNSLARDEAIVMPFSGLLGRKYGPPCRRTALAIAVQNGNSDMVRLLLVSGANPNGKGKPWEQVPLEGSVLYGYTGITVLLLDSHADTCLKDSFGHDALARSIETNQNILRMVLTHTPKTARSLRRINELEAEYGKSMPPWAATEIGHFSGNQR
jgi:Ankyrin repeat